MELRHTTGQWWGSVTLPRVDWITDGIYDGSLSHTFIILVYDATYDGESYTVRIYDTGYDTNVCMCVLDTVNTLINL